MWPGVAALVVSCDASKTEHEKFQLLLSRFDTGVRSGHQRFGWLRHGEKTSAESLSNDEFRQLYPRQYYESASPFERQGLDRQERERLWREKNQR